MHRDVTLLATKSSNKLKYLKLKERKNCKRSFYTVAKDISNDKFKKIVSYTLQNNYLLQLEMLALHKKITQLDQG